MVSFYISMKIIAVAVTVFSFNQGVNCDGEEGALETTQSPPMEHSEHQDSEHQNGEHQNGEHSPEVEGISPGYDVSPSGEDNIPEMATAASEDHTQVSTDQNPNAEDHSANPDDQMSGDDAGTTVNMDYDIPTEEPDKFGEELLTTCKAESNYQGDFSDPNESSRELKCFYACALVRMDVMVEVDGQMNFSEQVADDIVTQALGDNLEMIEKYKSAITACKQEVPNGEDRCEYAYAFITCGIQKLSG